MNNANEAKANALNRDQANTAAGLAKELYRPTEATGFTINIEHKTLGTLTKRVYSREDLVTFFSNFDMDNIWGVNIHPVV